MQFRHLITSIAICLVILTSILSGPGCANIVPPQGGPRDSLPPVLVKAEPGDSARNFKGTRITFTFDEFVDVQNVQEQLMVSPLPQNPPQVEAKLKTVTVRLKDSLEENTTYTIDFGTAIRDFTEGNTLNKFTYTFSTGNNLDSLSYSGKVVLAETGKADSTLIVILHTSSDDSAVVKERPRYVTRLDSTGRFTFKNLPAKTFYIYALKDPGNQKKYQNKKQLFAFADKPVAVGQKPEPVTLYAYAAEKDKPATAAAPALPNRGNTTGNNRLRFTTNLSENRQDLLDTLQIRFERPLKTFDTSKIKLYTDSTFKPVLQYQFVPDSSKKTVRLDIAWSENTLYHIIMDKDFAEDTTGKKLLKTDTLSFTTKKKADYGALKLKIRNLEMAKNPVLLLVQNNTVLKSVPLTSPEYASAMMIPGEYELRILYDDNKNGVWDPGEFFKKHKQPELVIPINRKIVIKANWQNEFEVTL